MKNDIFDKILDTEGGYVNNPADRGGPTNWGITESTARHFGFADIKKLTRQQAYSILENAYWLKPHFDEVAKLSPVLAYELCDSAVNLGPSVPICWLQRWLNVFNHQDKDFRDLDIDCRIGPRTIDALKAYLSIRGYEGEKILLLALNCSQGNHYLEISELRSQNETFIYGWLKNRVLFPNT